MCFPCCSRLRRTRAPHSTKTKTTGRTLTSGERNHRWQTRSTDHCRRAASGVHLRRPSTGSRMSNGVGSISQKRRSACSKRRDSSREITSLTLRQAPGIRVSSRPDRVGPGGSILATDISADMLSIAAHVAQQEGVTTITTRVMDAQQLDLEDNTFDAVICRLGLMLLPHPQRALSEIHRVLKPGGKLAALVWSAPEHNPLWSLPLAIVSRYASGAAAPRPNPFALSDPSVFERELTEAGFHGVSTHALPFSPITLRLMRSCTRQEAG